MKIKFLISFLLIFVTTVSSSQSPSSDSLQAARSLNELFALCRTVDFADPLVSKLGTFYKAAPYVIYRGTDKKRAWKDFADYKNADEKKGVDDICLRINSSVNSDTAFKIIKYFTEKESEGIWHVLMVSYRKKGVAKKAAFAFLKIGERFGLGDID